VQPRLTARIVTAALAFCMLASCDGTLSRSENDATTAIDDAPGGPGNMRLARDLNPDPDILEVNLVAAVRQVELNDSGLMANAHTFNGTIPGPELRMKVGDTAIIHFTNRLPRPMSIHWHGIELDNANDGTVVTQNPVPTGETFTYRFVVPRPGVFWYHPHAMPSNPEFKGLYGTLIVASEFDDKLIAAGVLPDRRNTRTLILADTTVCKNPGTNDAVTFATNSATAWAFTDSIGPFPGLIAYPTPRDLCESPRDNDGHPLDSGPLQRGEIPNIKPPKSCGPRSPCRVNEGQLVLTNGRMSGARDGWPENPGPLAEAAEVIPVHAGQGFRLQIINGAVSRFFRLRLTDQNGEQITMFRVGGEGGLLDRVRIEGGIHGKLNSKFPRGELMLANADRADVVFVARGKPGDVLTLWTLDYQHYGTAEYPFGYAGVPTVPVAHFKIVDDDHSAGFFEIAEGDSLRVHPSIDAPIDSLRGLPITAHLLDPQAFATPRPGLSNEEMLFTVVGLKESIDGIFGTELDGSGVADYRDIPHIASSRYAKLGDVLELTIRNGTQMHHPIHLHGFSFQPIRILDSEGNLDYEFDYNEFIDTFDVPATKQLVFRVHLEDRPVFATGEPGGGTGRWLMHCHIFNHAGVGMITELVVVKP
jgi:FtsP/CotA-like multicopper oxidase with cupredoxin domain